MRHLVVVVLVKAARHRLRRERLVDLDAVAELGARVAYVAYGVDQRIVRAARKFADEVRDVVFGFHRHVTRQLQRHHEDSALDDPAGSHVWHVLHQQVVRPDFKIVALITEPG